MCVCVCVCVSVYKIYIYLYTPCYFFSLPKEQVLLHWKYVMIYLFANTVACALCAGLLIIVDRRSVSIYIRKVYYT